MTGDRRDLDELLARWELYLRRKRLVEAREEALASSDRAGAKAVEDELTTLSEVPSLEALRANADLVEILTVQRLIAMRAAREEGASSAQIGEALGVSRQAAWEFIRRKIGARSQGPESGPARTPRERS